MMRRLLDWLRSFSFMDVPARAMAVAAGAVLTGAALGALAVGELDLLADRYPVTAVFEGSGGLKEGGAVRVAGVDVGEVTSVTPDFDLGQVVVAMEVDREVDLGPTTRARIAPNTVLGGFHVRLSGDVEEPYLAALPEDERRIPLERTRLAPTIVDVIEGTSRAVDGFDADAINQLVAQLGGLIEANAPAYQDLIDRIDEVSVLVSEREDELERVLESGASLTATLRSRDTEVLALAATAREVTDRLVERRDAIALLLAESAAASDGVSDLLAENREVLRATLDDLEAVLELTDARLDDVNRGLTLLPDGFQQLADAGDGGDFITVIVDEIDALPAGGG